MPTKRAKRDARQVEEEERVSSANEEIPTPLVFQCMCCRTIVGDSFSFVSSDAEMKTISLKACVSVALSEELDTSSEGKDRGSTYTKLNCASCSTQLGVVYLTTARVLDHLRDVCTLQTDAVSSYRLGSGDVGSTVDDSAMGQPLGGAQAKQIEQDMIRIKQTILHLNERLSSLETAAQSNVVTHE